MTHCTLDQLTRLRDSGLEPGLAAAREHLGGCAACQAEAARLDQRVARLRALPSLRPARDQWPMVRARLAAEQRQRRVRWLAIAGLAAAASVALVVSVRGGHRAGDAREAALSQAIRRSSQLEQLIQSYNPDARVTDGTTLRAAGELEESIALVDRQLEVTQMLDDRRRDEAMLRLWRQRVGLLDALVDVHLTRASNVGM